MLGAFVMSTPTEKPISTPKRTRATAKSAESPLWDAPQAAAYLAVGINRVYGMAKAGTLPCIRIGSSFKFHQPALDRWIAQQTGEAK
jgi:excisionase family DNA binding protein